MNEIYLKIGVTILGVIAVSMSWLVSHMYEEIMRDLYQRFG